MLVISADSNLCTAILDHPTCECCYYPSGDLSGRCRLRSRHGGRTCARSQDRPATTRRSARASWPIACARPPTGRTKKLDERRSRPPPSPSTRASGCSGAQKARWKRSLNESEAQWLGWRDTDCQDVAPFEAGMSAKGGDPRLSCIIDHDAQRIEEIKAALPLRRAAKKWMPVFRRSRAFSGTLERWRRRTDRIHFVLR